MLGLFVLISNPGGYGVKKFVSFLDRAYHFKFLASSSELREILNSPEEGLARRRNKKGKS
jgi:hypothetical protein